MRKALTRFAESTPESLLIHSPGGFVHRLHDVLGGDHAWLRGFNPSCAASTSRCHGYTVLLQHL
jgi:hypothetical protein